MSKIDQKSTKIDLPGVAREPREASWGLLKYKRLLERLPWGLLGRPGGVLGPSWWPTWPQLGPQNGAKIDQKSKQKINKILMPLEIRFSTDFLDFGVQNGGKLASKIEQNRCYLPKAFFWSLGCPQTRFWTCFWHQNQAPAWVRAWFCTLPQLPVLHRLWRYHVFLCNYLHIWNCFRIISMTLHK